MTRVLLASLLAAVCSAGDRGSPGSRPSIPPAPREAAGDPPRAPGADPRRAPHGPVRGRLGADAAPPGAPPPGADAAAITTGDACPGALETLNGYQDDDGCPDALPPELAAIVGVVDGVSFAVDKDHILLDASRPALDRVVEVLGRHPAVAIEVAVHEDARPGAHAYGRCLTCRRAQAIAHYLIAQGVAHDRVVARGYGPDRPIASNRSPAGRRQNRRIEIWLLGPDRRPITPPLAAAAPSSAAACVGRAQLRRADGEVQSCYPYVCRDGACLTRCESRRECAGAQDPSELADQGWPLECMPSGACTPMDPEKVQ